MQHGQEVMTRSHADYRDAYVMQGIQGLIWLAGYRLLVSHLVVFDRASSVRSKNSIGLTGIDLQSPQGCLNRPNLVVAEVEIVPTLRLWLLDETILFQKVLASGQPVMAR
jgi:hypothetical protein